MRVRFDRSEPGFWLSGVAHAAVLVAGLTAFSSTPTFPEAPEGIAVEVISEDQLSQVTQGEKTAEKVIPDARPRVDRQAEERVEREQAQDRRDAPAPPTRPADMPTADTPVEVAAPPPPPPPPRPQPDTRREAAEAERRAAEAKAQAAAQAAAREAQAKAEAEAQQREADAKAEAARAEAARQAAAREARARAEAAAKAKAEAEARAEAQARAEAERRRVAEERARAEARAREAAAAKAKAEAEAKAQRQAEAAQKFNPGDIRSLLRSKEANASQGSTGQEVNRTASLGAATGTARTLSMSQRDALMGLLRDQIERCYTAPISASTGRVVQPVLDIRLNPDGSLAGDPRVLRAGAAPADRAVAEAAMRAVRRCAPFRVPAQFAPYYGDWKVLNVEFAFPSA